MANAKMDPGQVARLAEIKRRAALHGRTLHGLCGLADMDHTQFKRWEKGDSSPIARTFKRKCEALEAELDRLDRAVVDDVRARGRDDEAEGAPCT